MSGGYEVRQQRVHVVADAITKTMADCAGAVQPGDEGAALARWEFADNGERLFEHADQGAEVATVPIADVIAETSGLFAVEDHQFGESGRFAHGLFVTGDGLSRLGHGNVLVAEHVRPEPAVYGCFVWLQGVVAEIQAGVEKRLDVLIGGVEVVNQGQ